MDVRDLRGRTAVVTGAGSGIGRATALAMGARGADLALCDVDEAGLEETAKRLREAGRRVVAQRVDVANPDAMAGFAEAVHAEVPAADLLVNNAGVALGASFLETRLEDWDWILRINLLGVVHGCHFFVPRMVERGRGGHVVNVASMAAYLHSDSLNAYNTTKAGVVALSESLRAELHRHRIGVTAVCPGVINTPILGNALLRGRADSAEARERIRQTFERRRYGPERVAEALLAAVRRNRAIAPVTPEAWVFYYAKRLAPGLVRWLTRIVGDRERARLEGASGPGSP